MVRVTYLSFLIGLTKNIQNKDVSIPTVEIFKKLIVTNLLYFRYFIKKKNLPDWSKTICISYSNHSQRN